MKITPVAQSSANPGEALGSVDVGRTASPMKLERARSIARGEKVAPEADPQVEKVKQNVRSIKMKTNASPLSVENATPVSEEPHPEVPPVEDPALSANPESSVESEEAVTQPISPQLAALAKQKRALQLERAQLDKEKAELVALKGSKEGTEALVSRLKSEPLRVLQEHGVTYDKLTEDILAEDNGASNAKIRELEAKLEALEKGVEKQFLSREEQAEEAALTEMLYEAESLAKEGEAYELIREKKAYDRVLQKIYDTYKKTGRPLDVSEAMNQVENELLDDAMKLAKLKKVQGKFTAPSEIPVSLQSQPQKQMRTLTARDTAVQQMSAKQRALAAFNGTLKR